MNEIIPDSTRMIEPVTIPVDRKRMGMVSIAPPTIELNIARTVVEEGFDLSLYNSLIIKCIYDQFTTKILTNNIKETQSKTKNEEMDGFRSV
jgi:hypothetical protein